MNNLPIEVQQLFEYLKAGTSAFHVIDHSKKVLTKAGFQELKLKETWNLEKGGRYFCVPFDRWCPYRFPSHEDQAKSGNLLSWSHAVKHRSLRRTNP